MYPTLTPEQQADVTARTDAFKAEYLALIEKHQVDFFSYPQLVPNKEGTFSTISSMTIVDKKYAPVPSNIAQD